jgi:intracellular sulfur oxidation DsrE/DsrF family protein
VKYGNYYLLWALAGAGAGLLWLLMASSPPAGDAAVATSTPPSARVRLEQADPELAQSRYVVDVSVHTRAELETLLDRVERLSADQAPPSQGPNIALVLHGPEITFFTRSNYRTYRELVDRVAALDARGVIDTRMCQTMMRLNNISEADIVPGFIEFVPYGPDEIDRLVGEEGRIRM